MGIRDRAFWMAQAAKMQAATNPSRTASMFKAYLEKYREAEVRGEFVIPHTYDSWLEAGMPTTA